MTLTLTGALPPHILPPASLLLLLTGRVAPSTSPAVYTDLLKQALEQTAHALLLVEIGTTISLGFFLRPDKSGASMPF